MRSTRAQRLTDEGDGDRARPARWGRLAESTGWGLVLSLAVLTAASITAVAFSVDAPLIRDDIGLSTVGVGAMTSAVYVGAALSSVAGGWLTDRRGPAPVLVGALVLLGVGCLLSQLARSVPLFFLGVLISGLGYGWVNPPTNVISNPINVRRRALSMSVKQTGIPLGGSLAGLLVAPVAAAHGWRTSLFVPITLCAVLAVVCARWCPIRSDSGSFAVASERTVKLKLPGGWAFGLLMNGVQGSIFAFLTLYLTEERGLSTASAGLCLSVLLVGGVLGRPFWGWASDRMHHDRVRVLQLTAAIAGVLLLLLASVPTTVVYLLLPVIGMSAVGWNGAFIATVAEAARAGTVGFDTGISFVMVNVGAVLAPPTVGALAGGRTGWHAAWILCAALSIGCALILQFSRRVAEAPACGAA
ncbi:MAG TPA: MFS transporter [Jatrophihabitans sp.]|nr:MFS transporter [Jatrophihabitans sp.]